MKLVPARGIISKSTCPEKWFGSHYNMNIYRGCSHGCIYCDSRSNCYQVENFSEVTAKEKALEIIEQDLRSKRLKGIVGTGAMSDPYNPQEKQYQLTRGALYLLHKYGFGVNITTKSDLVVRDIDILSCIREHSPVGVSITITASDDSLSQKIEPHVSPSSCRFAALKDLAANNIYCGILLMPVLPFISDSAENIRSIVRLAAENGARFIFPALGMTLRSGQREYFYKALDVLYPGLKEKYILTYGDAYQCGCPRQKDLWELFKNECANQGIVYKMPDIVQGIYSSTKIRQMGLL